jgi:hypothetical protein
MQPDIVVHRTLDYRAVTCFVVIVFLLGILLPPFGGSENLGLGITGLIVTSSVMYYIFGDRILFFDSHIEFRDSFGRVTGSWALDGSSLLSVQQVRTQSRWGRLTTESLVLINQDAVGLALPRGRYTKQRLWAEFVLEQHRKQRLPITDTAKAELRVRMGGK